MLLWGTSVLHVEHRSPPCSFYVGDQSGSAPPEDAAARYVQLPVPVLVDACVPLILAGEDGALTLVVPEGAEGWIAIAGAARATVAELLTRGAAEACAAPLSGARRLAFPFGSKARLELCGVSFFVSFGAAARAAAGRWHFDKKHLPFVIGSAILQVGLLGALSNFRAPSRAEGEISSDQMVAMQLALQTVDEKEEEARPPEPVSESPSAPREGGVGTRAKGEEGAMGAPIQRAFRDRYSVQGPAASPDSHLARTEALREAAEFGMIGMLNAGAGADPGAPAAPWGRAEALGQAPTSARGNAWGDAAGDAVGAGGLALSGIGAGSASRAIGASASVAKAAPMLPASRSVVETPIDPNGRFATTYRPGGGHLAAFESAVARGVIPGAAREVVSDVGARYAPFVGVPSGKALGLRADLERGRLAPGGGAFHLRLAMRSSEAAPAARPHLSVHLVLDVSGSMAGESITRARQAAGALVDKLAPTDDFSLTTFSSDAAVRVPDELVGPHRAAIKQIIAGIEADGGTNIGEGLTRGYEQASVKSIPEDAVRVVFLVSDGRANQGITSTERLSRLAQGAFQHGIQTSAFGLGADYDGALMSSIAGDGAGGYYYLRDASQIAPALATELDRRLDPVATAVEVRVRLKKAVSLLRVYGSRRLDDAEAARVRAVEVAADAHAARRDRIAQNRQDDAEGGMRFFIPAFARDDSHALLLELRVPAGAGGRPVALVELRYKDRIGKKNIVEELPVEAAYADSDAQSGATVDPSVARTVQGFAAGDALADAAARIARGDRGGAVGLLAEREAILRRAAETLGEPLFLRDADRLARLRHEAGSDQGIGEPLVLSMLLETAGRAHLR